MLVQQSRARLFARLLIVQGQQTHIRVAVNLRKQNAKRRDERLRDLAMQFTLKRVVDDCVDIDHNAALGHQLFERRLARREEAGRHRQRVGIARRRAKPLGFRLGPVLIAHVGIVVVVAAIASAERIIVLTQPILEKYDLAPHIVDRALVTVDELGDRRPKRALQDFGQVEHRNDGRHCRAEDDARRRQVGRGRRLHRVDKHVAPRSVKVERKVEARARQVHEHDQFRIPANGVPRARAVENVARVRNAAQRRRGRVALQHKDRAGLAVRLGRLEEGVDLLLQVALAGHFVQRTQHN